MRKVILIVVACVAMVSCGSSWELNGNTIDIDVCRKDTVVPAGTVILKSVKPIEIVD